jgi:hypothetical protein
MQHLEVSGAVVLYIGRTVSKVKLNYLCVLLFELFGTVFLQKIRCVK